MIFDIFRRKVNCNESKSLMLNVFSELEVKYPYIFKQLKEDLISGCRSLKDPFNKEEYWYNDFYDQVREIIYIAPINDETLEAVKKV